MKAELTVTEHVNQYIEQRPNWSALLTSIRKVLLSSGLEETVKWGAPVYTLKGKNLLGIGAFKSYAGVWFYQGALLSDPLKVLINAQEGKTKALRQWRFSDAKEFSQKHLQAYVKEAIENHQQGKTITPAKPRTKPLVLPKQLQQKLKEDKGLNQRFTQLGLTRKREFADYIAEAKQDSTKARRLEKVVNCLQAGHGLYEKPKSP